MNLKHLARPLSIEDRGSFLVNDPEEARITLSALRGAHPSVLSIDGDLLRFRSAGGGETWYRVDEWDPQTASLLLHKIGPR